MAALDPLIIEKLGLDKLQDPRRNYMSIDDTMEGLDFGGSTPAPQQVIDTSPIESAAPSADSTSSPSLTRDDLYGMMMQRYMSQEAPDAPLVPAPTTDDVVSTAITGLAPVLLGLLLKGKKGAGIGGVIGGKFADQQVQQRRTEAAKKAELTDKRQAEGIQRVLAMRNADDALEEKRLSRQDRAAGREDMNSLRQGQLELNKTNSELSRDLKQQSNERAEDEFVSKRTVPDFEWRRDPKTGKEIPPNPKAADRLQKISATANEALGKIDELESTWANPDATKSQRQAALTGAINAFRKEGFANTGTTYTASERALIQAIIPPNMTLPDILEPRGLLTMMQQIADDYGIEQATSTMRGAVDLLKNSQARSAGFVPYGFYDKPEEAERGLFGLSKGAIEAEKIRRGIK